MEKKKNIRNLDSFRSILSFRNIGGNLFRKEYFSSFISHFSFPNKGFTLIELLVAVAIIGVLAGSLLFVLNPGEQLKKSNDARRKTDLYQIRNALDLYYGDYNRYPRATVEGKIEGTEWGGQWSPYMPTLPKDPISNQSYYYEAADDGSWYRLYAKLGRCSDAQVITGIDCSNASYNYSVTSTNVSAVAFGGGQENPTSAPVLTPSPIPTSTPMPGPTSAPAPTSTPALTPSPIPTATLTPAPIGLAEHPVQDKGLTTSRLGSSGDLNMGHIFTFNRSGRITQLWTICDAGTRTVRLYRVNSNGSANEVRSVDITAQGVTSWTAGNITSYDVTAGASYIVAVRSGSNEYCYLSLYNLSFALPFTIGSVTVGWAGYGYGSSAPPVWETATARGLVDITFVPD